MHCLDYRHSYVCGTSPVNSLRLWIESRVTVTDDRSGRSIDYYQCASCKSENTFAPQDLFHKNNYDFLPIFGPEDGVIFRRRASLNADYRQIRQAADMWAGQTYRLVRPRKLRLLRSPREIRAATHAGVPLVAQTEISDPQTRLRAILEFPVKTMNIHDERDLYQVDSGPVAFPDLTQRPARMAESLHLAFVAFNAPGRVVDGKTHRTCRSNPS